MTTKQTPPSIRVLATGGTIAGARKPGGTASDYESGVLAAGDLLTSVPGLSDKAAVTCRQIANIGSEDMTEKVWFDLAREVRQACADDGVDGVVILHGTDTMEETAYFLDLLRDWNKPVVLTGSMRTADSPGADGPVNIYDAVCLAASSEAAGAGVVVCMNGLIHAAKYAVKTDTSAVDAFHSANAGPMGRMADGVPVFFWKGARRGWRLDDAGIVEGRENLPPVAILYGHAGQTGALVEAAVNAGVWGIVYAGVGMGQIHREARAALARAAAGGVVVVRSSRVGNGPVPDTLEYRRDNFIAAGVLNPQKARVLLQLALVVTDDVREIRGIFGRA